MSKAKSWNWCHKCKQLVDIDDNTADGCEVKCWGCRRRFVATYFENGKWSLVPLESKFQGEAKAHARRRRLNERKS